VKRLLWHASGTAHRDRPPPRKGADYHVVRTGKCSHAQSVSLCPSSTVTPRESPCERARKGHKPRSPEARCAGLPQDMRGESGYPVASAGSSWSGPGAGVHVEHPAAERHGPLPVVCYAFAADVAGYPRSW
jgi:hypothetical protein